MTAADFVVIALFAVSAAIIAVVVTLTAVDGHRRDDRTHPGFPADLRRRQSSLPPRQVGDSPVRRPTVKPSTDEAAGPDTGGA